MKSVFRLVPIKAVDISDGNDTSGSTEPRKKYFFDKAWLFATSEEAENALKQLRKSESKDGVEYYCFYIQELPMEKEYSILRLDEYLSWEVYDNKGNLIHYSVCPSIPDEDGRFEVFGGRHHNIIPFKRGDLVEVLDIAKGTVTPMVVVEPPMTPDVCESLGLLDENAKGLDYSADAYTLSAGPVFSTKSSLSVPSMFVLPISKKEYARLKKEYGKELNAILEQYRQKLEEYDD